MQFYYPSRAYPAIPPYCAIFSIFSEHNGIDQGENNLDQVIEALQMDLFADIRNSNPERKVGVQYLK